MSETVERGGEIRKDPNICDGAPVVEGTRTRVLDIVIAFEHEGLSPDEIVDRYPQLDLGDVHSALSYYYKNVEEIKEALRKKDELWAEK
ncbi:hypothetical protein AKJ37_00925 [candidate division MSBL1 archaeon SCGC-AAA259I09]|uniref:Antitoxin n=2 Tax=candidate division MSBL1 TaxID=215777 RepID=A0A133UTN6_9EURY|nr:hypothetical protein AKJ38_00905 [candidate division MSBL1 archaeon SCGC-AAA259I14]KXA98183.1 hypothetical protein AKJ37_00925 [candidate division MSBL1 archaeon SCGC-AAA259I09]